MCDETRGCPVTTTHLLRLQVMDNYGHPNYTCIYNIKLFGDSDGPK